MDSARRRSRTASPPMMSQNPQSLEASSATSRDGSDHEIDDEFELRLRQQDERAAKYAHDAAKARLKFLKRRLVINKKRKRGRTRS